MLCYKMWSRNFVPDYGIRLLAVGVVLTILAASIDSAEGRP